MPRRSSLPRALVLGSACLASLAATTPAAALSVTTYTDRPSFLAALANGSEDAFDDLTIGTLLRAPLSRTVSSYEYSVVAPAKLYGGYLNNTTNPLLSTLDPQEPLTLIFTAGAPTAVGGFFFNTVDFSVEDELIPVSALISASINGSQFGRSATTASATNFFGWISNDGTPITSLTITPDGVSSYATFDQLLLGQALPFAPASLPLVPAPLPLVGTAIAWRWSRRLRTRLRRPAVPAPGRG